MVSNVCFVPELDLGIAILTNNDNQNFFEALRYQILDVFTGTSPRVDRSEQFWPGQEEDMKKQVAEIAAFRARVKAYENHTINREKYCGKYKNELYGKLVVTAMQAGLQLEFEQHPALKGYLQYMGNEEWLLSFNNIEYGVYPTRFILKNEKPKGLKIKVNDFIEFDEYIFEKD